MPGSVSLYRRGNVGYDFGSWAAALRHFPALSDSREVLLVNDSFLGPFRSLGDIVADFRASETPVWGLVSSAQVAWHLQSHFIGYRAGVLSHPVLRRFWHDIRALDDKERVIAHYELGLSWLLTTHEIPASARYPYTWVTPVGCNVTVEGWSQLLRVGFPFIKRELLKAPEIQTAIMRIDRDDVVDRARDVYGVDLWEWM
jgi:hypothetical protein